MAIPVGQSKYALGIIGDFQARNLSKRVKYEFFGDWNKADRVLSGLSKRVMRSVNAAVYAYAKNYKKQVIIAISTGLSSWAPLSPKYVATKSSKGYYTGFYQMRGVLIKAIQVEKHPKGIRVNISTDPKFKNRTGTLTASQVVNILEHGSVTKGIPARPLFGPVWKKMGGNKAFMAYVQERVGKTLRNNFN